MALFDLADQLELPEGRIEIAAAGAYSASRGHRQVEHAAAQRPASLIPFSGRAVGVSPAVAGIVERPGIDQRPVEEIAFRIVRVSVGVEDIDDREAADREHQPVRRL